MLWIEGPGSSSEKYFKAGTQFQNGEERSDSLTPVCRLQMTLFVSLWNGIFSSSLLLLRGLHVGGHSARWFPWTLITCVHCQDETHSQRPENITQTRKADRQAEEHAAWGAGRAVGAQCKHSPRQGTWRRTHSGDLGLWSVNCFCRWWDIYIYFFMSILFFFFKQRN